MYSIVRSDNGGSLSFLVGCVVLPRLSKDGGGGSRGNHNKFIHH